MTRAQSIEKTLPYSSICGKRQEKVWNHFQARLMVSPGILIAVAVTGLPARGQ